MKSTLDSYSPPGPLERAISIIPFKWWHIAALQSLERELFGAEQWTPAMFWSELAQFSTRYYRIAINKALSSVKEQVIVGYAGLCVYGEAPSAQAWIQTLAVAPHCQRKGVGTALLADLIGQAKLRGAATLSLEVRTDNVAAQHLYAKHGFEPVGIRRGYYQPSNKDALTMTAEL
jgi:[ribosomal protein S18]-alanine N-acetyltransferase